ncbi:hypothetical protein H8E06_01050 [bacterium]|nr:hypothetical protein [bacterium]
MAFLNNIGTTISDHVTDVGTGFRNAGQTAYQNIAGIGVVTGEAQSNVTNAIQAAPPWPKLELDLASIAPINNQKSPITKETQGLLNDVNASTKSLLDLASEQTRVDIDLGDMGVIQGVGLDLANMRVDMESPAQLKRRVAKFARRVKDEVMKEIRRCIEKHLKKLLAENPLLRAILDPENLIAEMIQGLRDKLKKKMDLIRRKIQLKRIQRKQITAFRVSILSEISKICPEASPTAVKKYQDNSEYLDKTVTKTTDKIMGRISDLATNIPL